MTTKQAAERIIEPNCKNRTVFIGDNWEVMLCLNRNIADAIITDPPFNKEQMRKDDKMKVDKKKSKQLGFLADAHGQAIQHYKDNWKIADLSKKEKKFIKYKDKGLLRFCQIIGNQHSDGMEAYLLIMACRLLLCHELLKETGSVFVHCDHSANAYLRMLMDAIFGRENFRNEIVWRKYAGRKNNAKYKFCTQHETIFFYAKSPDAKFNPIMIPHSQKEIANEYKFQDADGRRYRKSRGRRYQLTGEERRIYLDESKGRAVGTLWVEDGLQLNTSSSERCEDWKDQKPVSLYTRLIKAVTDPGDLVIDPFCGCATTLIAAENCGRQWIGIDQTPDRVKLIRPQMEKLITGDMWKEDFQIIKRKKDFPKRTDDTPPQSEKDEFKAELLKRQRRFKGNCYYYYCKICEHPFREEYLEIDHIHPKSLLGDWDLKNLQLLCSRCNRRKGSTKENEDVRKELAAEGLLYHQRAAVYQELTGDSLIDSEAYVEEEENPKKQPRRNRKKAKKVSRRKKNDSQPEMGL